MSGLMARIRPCGKAEHCMLIASQVAQFHALGFPIVGYYRAHAVWVGVSDLAFRQGSHDESPAS